MKTIEEIKKDCLNAGLVIGNKLSTYHELVSACDLMAVTIKDAELLEAVVAAGVGTSGELEKWTENKIARKIKEATAHERIFIKFAERRYSVLKGLVYHADRQN
jgi:hypothetical protein